MQATDIENKHATLERFLDEGMVLMAVDARVPGVDVPEHLFDDPKLRLNLSYRFRLPLELNAWGVVATLTFGAQNYACRLPWVSIFLMVSHTTGEPQLFAESVPPELAAEVSGVVLGLESQRAQERIDSGEDIESPSVPLTRVEDLPAGELDENEGSVVHLRPVPPLYVVPASEGADAKSRDKGESKRPKNSTAMHLTPVDMQTMQDADGDGIAAASQAEDGHKTPARRGGLRLIVAGEQSSEQQSPKDEDSAKMGDVVRLGLDTTTSDDDAAESPMIDGSSALQALVPKGPKRGLHLKLLNSSSGDDTAPIPPEDEPPPPEIGGSGRRRHLRLVK